MRRLVRIIDSINIWTGKTTSSLLIVMALIIIFEVIMRGFFRLPTMWVHETSGMMFGATFMLGAGYILYHDAHVKVDILTSHFRPRVLAGVNIITHLVMITYCTLVLWKAWRYAVLALVRMDESASGWHPILFPIKFVIVIGLFLLLLQLVAKYIRDFYLLFTGKELITREKPSTMDETA